MAGRFITFEGGEGAGKSTQVRHLATKLEALGYNVLVTREPGGTANAEAIRDLLLGGRVARFGAQAEALLFAVARADHVETVIAPALADGTWVLCDRFADSTRVYQGATGGVPDQDLTRLERLAVGETTPDLTVILDLPADIGMRRAAVRRDRAGDAPGAPDRFERDALAVHEARRQGFLDIARNDPARCMVIDAGAPEDKVAEQVWQAVRERLLEQ